MKLPVVSALALVWLGAMAVSAQDCNGRCVPRQYCEMDDDDAAPDVDLRIGGDDSGIVGSCSHYLQICCPFDSVVEEPTSTRQKENFQTCGQSNPNGVVTRIGAGKSGEAEFGEFPWTLLVLEMLDLFDDFPPKEVYACVGSLIAPNVALTVAHCVVKRTATNLVVRAGEWDTKTDNEVMPNQDVKVKTVLVHERYNKHHHFDVALLVLERPFQPADNVQTVCLPPPGLRPGMGTECITGGWGKERFDQEVYQQILKRVDLPIVESGRCQEMLRTTRLGRKYKLHNTFLCAGGKLGVDVCSGDGGAALVCPVPGRLNTYYQAGIVAWGIGCADENIPGVYVDVASVRSWIMHNLESLDVDPAFYTIV